MCNEEKVKGERSKEELLMLQILITIEGIARQLNSIADRNLEIVERSENLFDRSEKFFREMREQFLQKIITAEVEKEQNKIERQQKFGRG